MTRPTIDELEIMSSDQLGELFRIEVKNNLPDPQFMQDLITVGCPLNYKNLGHYALCSAIIAGDLKMVILLVSGGVDVNARYYQGEYTPLHIAAKSGQIHIIKFLVSAKCDIHARDPWGRTTWDYVCSYTKKAVPELNPK